MAGSSSTATKMEIEARTEILKIVETLTHSGDPALDEKLMKKIKNYCRSSDIYVQLVYDRLMRDVATEHSEVRLSSFQMIDELFQRSHLFRQLITSDCQKLILLVCGVEPLPPPQSAASKLKETSLLSFKQWVEKFGEGYPKLKLGYNYLKHSKKVDFDGLIAATQGEQRRQEEREKRQRAFLEQRLEKIKVEMSGQYMDSGHLWDANQTPDIKGCLFEMESCFKILMPNFVDAMSPKETCPVPSISDSQTSTSNSDALSQQAEPEASVKTIGSPSDASTQTGSHQRRLSGTAPDCTDDESDDSDIEWEEIVSAANNSGSINGLVGRNPTLTTITVPQLVQVNRDDNETLVATLRERFKLVNKTYLPRINKWIEWFTKAGQETLLKEAIDLKAEVLASKDKYSELNIIGLEKESEEEPEDTVGASVPLEPTSVLSHCPSLLPWTTAVACYHRTPVGLEEDLALDPTTPQAQMKAKGLLNQSKIYPKGKINSTLDEVPPPAAATVPFDVDLIHWGESQPPEIMPTAMDSLHRYWCAEPELKVSEDVMASLQCRNITYTGDFKPIERSCRAPLPSGSLCPRKDKIKCPLHGIIIPRDEDGEPVGSLESTGAKGNTEEETEKKKPRLKKKKYPGLTDIKKLDKTPKNRIESKILNKRVLSRVGRKLDALDQRKGKAKFSDNFNYALKS